MYLQAESSKTKKELDKVIDDIKKSLDEKYWIDQITLEPKKGDKVFKEEGDGVHKLLKILGKDDDDDEDDDDDDDEDEENITCRDISDSECKSALRYIRTDKPGRYVPVKTFDEELETDAQALIDSTSNPISQVAIDKLQEHTEIGRAHV